MNRVFYRYVTINYRAILGTLAAVCFRKISCIYRKLAPNVYIVVTFGLIFVDAIFFFFFLCWILLGFSICPLGFSPPAQFVCQIFFPLGFCLPLLVYYWDFVLHPSAYYWNFLPPGIPPPGILSYIRLLMTPVSVHQCCSLRRSDTWVK